MRAAENCMCILKQSAVHGSVAECTRIRCSAQKTDYTIGISWRLRPEARNLDQFTHFRPEPVGSYLGTHLVPS